MILGKWDFECPRRPILDDPDTYGFIFAAHAHYQNGYLMEEGSVMDQPARLMKMVAIISDQVIKCSDEKQQVERERTEANRRRDSQNRGKKRHGGVE
jgi:hypothetical protein